MFSKAFAISDIYMFAQTIMAHLQYMNTLGQPSFRVVAYILRIINNETQVLNEI